MTPSIIGGQKVNYNLENNFLYTSIDKPFMSAGKKIGWRWSAPGIGLNLKICKLILDYHLNLKVYIDYYHQTYNMSNDRFYDYLRFNDCDYKIRDTVLKVIPIELLTPVRKIPIAT